MAAPMAAQAINRDRREYGSVDPEGGSAVFESGANCKDLPPDIRLGFIKKTYALLFYMLTITFGITSLFLFHPKAEVMSYLGARPWIMITTTIVFGCMYIVNMCVMMSMFCGTGFYNQYMKLFKTFPINYVFLTVVAASFGVLMGILTLQYKVQSVLIIFAVSMALIAALTAYAVKTEADFTGMGMYILVAVVALMFTGLLCAILPIGADGIMNRIFGGLGAMLFGFIIVYDTQLIFGESKWSPHTRQIQFTVDMYAYAAYHLYLDFINFIIYMLRLFGERR